MLDLHSRYKPNNALERQHVWKLHCEPDVGVPLAPSAMDHTAYDKIPVQMPVPPPPLHPNDADLLEWNDRSMGDTAAEELQKRRDRARANVRLALQTNNKALLAAHQQQSLATTLSGQAAKGLLGTPSSGPSLRVRGKNPHSRVLNEGLQSFMKKTTYLSNDYSRKVHDFTSLAQTKQKLSVELQKKQQEILEMRSAKAIEQQFQQASGTASLKHFQNPKAKPVWSAPLLPNVQHWGDAFTHVVLDHPPKETGRTSTSLQALESGFVAHVEQKQAAEKMVCQLLVPKANQTEELQAIQRYDLDVIPLKQDGEPYVHFCLWINTDPTVANESDKEQGSATYTPISSRVQLSTGRPVKNSHLHTTRLSRRMERTLEEEDEYRERLAEVDRDVAAEMGGKEGELSASRRGHANDGGELDNDDSDSDSDHGFGNTHPTIAAEG